MSEQTNQRPAKDPVPAAIQAGVDAIMQARPVTRRQAVVDHTSVRERDSDER